MSELEAQIRALSQGALPLAIARYLREHPEARKRVPKVWLDDEVETWSARPVEDIAAEARHRLEVLDGWREEASDDDPDLLDSWRTEALYTRMNLQAAASGAFGTASGPLVDFLTRVGAPPRSLDLF